MRTRCAQQRLEVEVAGIVDQDRVAGFEQKAADEIERVRAAVGQQDLLGRRVHAMLREPPGKLLTQRG